MEDPMASAASGSRVAVVIVTWNGADEIGRCLESVKRSGVSRIWVIDNGSTDGTVGVVRDRCPGADVVELKWNVGFAAGVNIGIARSDSDYVLLLNSDVTLEPDYVDVLVEALDRDPRAGSAVGKLVYNEESHRHIDSTGIQLRRYALSPLDRGFGELDSGQYDKPERIPGPSAAAAIYRRAAIVREGVEVFDESLFAYYEDVDLAWRLARAGWHHLYVPAAVAWHRRRGPAEKPTAISEWAFGNRYLVFAKNLTAAEKLVLGPIATTWELVHCLRLGLRGRLPLRATLAGLQRLRARDRRTVDSSSGGEPQSGSGRRRLRRLGRLLLPRPARSMVKTIVEQVAAARLLCDPTAGTVVCPPAWPRYETHELEGWTPKLSSLPFAMSAEAVIVHAGERPSTPAIEEAWCAFQADQIPRRVGSDAVLAGRRAVASWSMQRGDSGRASVDALYLERRDVPAVVYVLPGTGLSGGVTVVVEHARRLRARGIPVALAILDQSVPATLDWIQASHQIPIIHADDLVGVPDVLVATGWSTAYWVATRAARRRIYFVQSNETRFYGMRSLQRRAAARSYRLPLEYVTIADWLCEWLTASFGQRPTKIPVAIGDGFLQPGSSLAPRGARPRILLEGAIDLPFKGMEDAFRAVDGVDAEVWCVSSSGRPKPHWRCDRFFEQVPYEQMPAIYRSCDILLKMSRVEGVFLPPLEMMACGGVCVVARVTGMAEYIRAGENALVVEPSDVGGAREAINRLLGDRALHTKLVEAGRETAATWSWGKAIDSLAEYYCQG